MEVLDAFVCYTRDDDKASLGGIRQLAEDIGMAFDLLTGQKLNVIFDLEILVWGHEWRVHLEAAITKATFFIPFITPRFFQSTECKRELELFLKVARELNRSELVMPILWAPVRELREDSLDPVIAHIAAIHREDWTELRLCDRTGESCRKGTHELASAIVKRVDELNDLPQGSVPTVGATNVDGGEDGQDFPESDEPGFLEVLAENETAADNLVRSLEAITATFNELAEVSKTFQPMIERANADGSTSKKVVIISEFAKAMLPHVEKLEAHVAEYRGHLDGVDRMYGVLLPRGTDEPNRESARKLAEVIVEGAESGLFLIEQMATTSDAFAGLENVTRAMRTPVRRLRAALQSFRDTGPTLVGWADDARDLLMRLDDLDQPPHEG